MNPLIPLTALAAVPTQHWDFKTSSTPDVEVSNVEGGIEVQGLPGDRVTIDGAVETSSSDTGRWTLEVWQEGGTVHASACCGSCAERNSDRHCNGSVRWTVSAPPGAKVNVSAVSSMVKVSGIRGGQHLSTVDGAIASAGSESVVEASSVSGSVRIAPATMGRTRVETVSGDVSVRLPTAAGAEVSYSSVSGALNGESVVLGSARRTLGPGGSKVIISTVSGNADVR
jgi:hypothetical protein